MTHKTNKLGWLSRLNALTGKYKWVIILLALAAIGWSGWQALKPADKDNSAKLAAVKADPRIFAEGIVVPIKYSSLSFKVAGNLSEIYVAEGQQVKAGQLLARLANDDVKGKAASAQASYEKEVSGLRGQEVRMKQAMTELQKAACEQAKTDFERMEQLYKNNAVSRQQYDQSKTALIKARSELDNAQADYEMALAGTRPEVINASQAEALAAVAVLSDTELRATFDGTVAYLNHKVGEYAAAGEAVVRLGVLSEWMIETDDLTELQIARVKEGAKVTLAFDALPEVELGGTVMAIRAFGEKKRGDMTYTVFIKPDRYEPRLKWNMTATVKIEPLG